MRSTQYVQIDSDRKVYGFSFNKLFLWKDYEQKQDRLKQRATSGVLLASAKSLESSTVTSFSRALPQAGRRNIQLGAFATIERRTTSGRADICHDMRKFVRGCILCLAEPVWTLKIRN
jgi:hypothetical protein